MTTFTNKCNILSELWMGYRGEEGELQDFISYNDLGLPLAHFISIQIVESTVMAEKYVEETFALLLESLGRQDTGFEVLQELIG